MSSLRRCSLVVACLLVSQAVAAALASSAAAAGLELKAIDIRPAASQSNLVANPGFELPAADHVAAQWYWDRRNTQASCELDADVRHCGRHSLRLRNRTPAGAHVYGMLSADLIRVTPGQPYTMSVWAKSDGPCQVSLIGGADWSFRLSLSGAADGQWRRFSKTFTPELRDADFGFRIVTEGPTAQVWLDDVKIEVGTAPTPDLVAGPGDQPVLEVEQAAAVVAGDGPFALPALLLVPRKFAGKLQATLDSGESLEQPLAVEPGAWQLSLSGKLEGGDDAPRALTLRFLTGDDVVAEARQTVRCYSTAAAQARLARLRAGLPQLAADLSAVQARGQDVSYPRIGFTVLDNFVGYVEQDLEHQFVQRACEQLGDLERIEARLRGELQQALRGETTFAPVPRWTGAARPRVQSSSFLGPVRLGDGTVSERPVFFNGFGHFGQCVADLEKWPHLGTNIIQIEVGPSGLFPAEGQTNAAPIDELRRTLDRAQKAGVAVCLLISPHYFPEWALVKWPHLRQRREGFLQYNLHAPESQELLRRYVAELLTPLKDHPALHSICLSNEPLNKEAPLAEARPAWYAWLEKRHGDIAPLNRRYGSQFGSFSEVPLPSPFEGRPGMPLWMDYVRFNQEFFADWHALLAAAVHQAAPNLPVHSKAMNFMLLGDDAGQGGVDATLFAGFSNINGNDAVNDYELGSGEFAQSWVANARGHDLQRSLLDAPVFNSENHIIPDRETRPIPPAHLRAALWQAAVHGQSATTLWVWERTYDPRNDFSGSIMHRPECAQAVGVVNCDLNRAALEVTALQQAPSDVLLLQSTSAGLWDQGDHTDCLDKLYTALSFTGLKIGFVTERQLEKGLVPATAVLLVPAVVHFSDSAFDALHRYRGRLVLVGDGPLLERTEYDQSRANDLPAERLAYRYGATTEHDLLGSLGPQLVAWKLVPAVQLRMADDRPPWGVEWRSARMPTGTVVNVCNYLKTPVKFDLLQTGEPAPAHSVLTGKSVVGSVELAPLEVLLLRIDGP